MAELTGDELTVVKMTGDELTVAENAGDDFTGDELTVAENARDVDMLAGGLGFIEETEGEVQGKVSEDLAGGSILQKIFL